MTTTIPLRGKDGLGHSAIVDDADLELLAGYSWRGVISGHVLYAVTDMLVGDKWRTVRMHRFILKAASAQLIDHKNRNGIDNRRDNLRRMLYRAPPLPPDPEAAVSSPAPDPATKSE